MQNDASPIGFVVIGRNEGERLRRSLASLPSGALTVYVDSGSSDGSCTLARSRGARVEELDLETPFTAARARNAGFRALRALAPQVEYVQFLDGDCILSSAWPSLALAFLDQHQNAAVVCGRRREVDPGASVYNRLCDDEWNTPVGEAEACGGDALFRVAPFEAVGGFNAVLVAGEEPELCTRLRSAGWTIWRLDAEMTGHDAAIIRFGQWWKRAARGGFGYAQVWLTTRHAPISLYGRSLARALFWAGVLPTAAIVLMPLSALSLVVLLGVYAAQVIRMALRGGKRELAWTRAFFTLVAKFAELQGAALYLLHARATSARSAIEYK